MQVVDIAGQTFNHLTVIERIPSTRPGAARWSCQCKCGNTVEYDGIDIRSGKIKSCGCIRKDDITGQKFGRLTVLRPSKKTKNGRALWVCRCECGNKTRGTISLLRAGKKQSCGCIRKDPTRASNFKHGLSTRKERDRTYNIWVSMRARCNNPKHKDYDDYGGRGIAVCSRWNDYPLFLKDMGEAPTNMTIERKKVNEGYSPENCIWATRQEQARNRRDTRTLTCQKITRPVWEWSELLGIPTTTIYVRLGRGCTPEEALTVGRLPRRF